MSKSIRAAVCREFAAPLVIEDVMLDAPMEGQVQIDLKACAICHSDLSYVDGHWGGSLPAVYGHEGAGIVSAVGAGVTQYATGDHVVVTLVRHCDDCHYCARQAEALCESAPGAGASPIKSENGDELEQAMHCGAFAEKVVVHESQLVKVPHDLPFDVASLLACGVITGYGAVSRASALQSGQHAVVIGCGGVGLNSIQAARHAGAQSIIAMDLAEDKLEIAKKFGATHGIHAASEDAATHVMEITEGRGADFVFVTVGAKRAIDAALSYIGKMGQVVIVGMPPSGVMNELDAGTMASWGQGISGTKMGNTKIDEDIPMLVTLYREGKLKLDELISGRFALDNINEALDGVRKGEAVKNVIVFDR